MLFVVLFNDRPEAFALREREMAAHLAFLKQHEKTVKVAGSLRESPEYKPMGACWIVEAANKAAVQALIEADPFHAMGLRASHRILHWSKAFDKAATV